MCDEKLYLDKFIEALKDIKRIYCKKIIKEFEIQEKPIKNSLEYEVKYLKTTIGNINIPSKPGVYYFEVHFLKKTCKKTFINKWGKHKYSPAANKENINIKERKLINWVPFYIGKSKELKERVTQHIKFPNCKTTYALRLSEKKDLLKTLNIDKIRIRYFELDDFSNNDIYFMVEQFEREVRNKFKPIVGKQ